MHNGCTRLFWKLTGEINVAQGKLDKASRRYSGVLLSPFSLPEEKTQAQYCLAEIQYFQGNFDSASSILQKIALALSDDESNDALLLLHFIKENQAGYGNALKEYAHAALLERQKKFSEAIPVLTSIIQALPMRLSSKTRLSERRNSPLFSARTTMLLPRTKNFFPIIRRAFFATKRSLASARVYQFQLKDKDKAIHAYEELLASYPNSLFIEQSRKRIREFAGGRSVGA